MNSRDDICPGDVFFMPAPVPGTWNTMLVVSVSSDESEDGWPLSLTMLVTGPRLEKVIDTKMAWLTQYWKKLGDDGG